jgi:aspartate carbamoyltransferase catalytic subunit
VGLELLSAKTPVFPKDLISIHDLEREHFDYLFELAGEFEKADRRQYAGVLSGIVVAMLFYQPSTRTRLSFESAAQRLGAVHTGFADPKTTRAGDYYQETLEDTVRTVAQLADCLVIRHFEDDAPQRAAEICDVPIISAGAGYGEHPTQALGDLWTLSRAIGSLDGAVIGLVGDVSVRSLRPISIGLSRFNVQKILYLTAPGTVLPHEIEQLFSERHIPWEYYEDVADLIRDADAIETIGIRHPDHNLPLDQQRLDAPTPARYRIDRALLQRVGRQVPILHPGARKDEIDTDVDTLAEAIYFTGVGRNLWIRVATLARILTDTQPA